jgi:membrane-bound hydrogenase subunit alpha
MEPGPIRAIEKIPAILANIKKAEGEGIGRHEAPRGEVFHYVRTFEGDDKLYTWKVRAPSNANLLTWIPMLTGGEIADIPIVVASVDPCLSCTNRITYVDLDSRSEGYWTMNDLHRMSVEKTRRLMR